MRVIELSRNKRYSATSEAQYISGCLQPDKGEILKVVPLEDIEKAKEKLQTAFQTIIHPDLLSKILDEVFK